MLRGEVRSVEVDVWVAEPVAWLSSMFRSVLDPAECARAAGMPSDRAAGFVIARALLRGVLAPRLGWSPSAVVLRAVCRVCGGPHGQTEVLRCGDTGASGPAGGLTAAGPPAVRVSVSRAGPLIAVAVSEAGPVGVDVESHASVAHADVASVALSQAELAAHRRLPPEARAGDLTRAWVRKESVLKALGTGLRLDPAVVDVRGAAVRVRATEVAGGVAVADLDLGPGLAGAVAVSPGASDVRGRLGGVGRLSVRRHAGDPVLADLADG